MLLRWVEVRDVRSYAQAALDLEPGVTLLVGPNAQGKTNLLEAIHRAASGMSHRVATDAPLIRVGAERGYIRLRCETDAGRARSLEVELAPGRGARARVDGQDVRRAAEAAGILRVVLFAPEDLAIVRGDPAERRRFLDSLLAQRRPAYAAAHSDYERVVRQRNSLLKQVRSLPREAARTAAPTLAAWTEQLVSHGATLLAARLAAVHALSAPVDQFYRWLAGSHEPVALTYAASAGGPVTGDPTAGVPDRGPLEDALRSALTEVAEEERRRGVTLVGPHRDDLDLAIGGLSGRAHASHGEAWSLALALKLATYEVLAEVGDRPVVLLDDVFAELDETRRHRLAESCSQWDQVLVTAAVEADVPLRGGRVEVEMIGGATSLRPRVAGQAP